VQSADGVNFFQAHHSLTRTIFKTQIQHRAHRGAEYTERNSGHKSPRAPQLQRAPWATRAFLPGSAQCCGSHKPHPQKRPFAALFECQGKQGKRVRHPPNKRRPRVRAPAQWPIQKPQGSATAAGALGYKAASSCDAKISCEASVARAKPRTDPKRAYIYYSVRVKRDPRSNL